LGFGEGRDGFPGVLLGSVPDTRAGRANAAFRRHCSCFGNHKPCPAYGVLAKVCPMPTVWQAIRRRVLAHRCYPEAVRDGEASQSDGVKEVWCGTHGVTRVVHRQSPKHREAGSAEKPWKPTLQDLCDETPGEILDTGWPGNAVSRWETFGPKKERRR
jgi:hypothetical protein